MVAKSRRAMLPQAPPPRWSEKLQVVLALGLLCASLSLGSVLLRLDEPARAATQVEVRVLGGPVLPESHEPPTLALALARAWLREEVTLEAGERRHALARAALGVRVELEALTALLVAARDPGSPLRRVHAQVHGAAPLVLPVPARLEGGAAHDWLTALAAGLAEPARPARVEPGGRVHPPQPGRTLDVEGTLDRLADAVFRGHRSLQARFIVQPAPETPLATRSIVDLGSVLGRGESTLLEDDPTRAHNLRVAARALDGTLIAPTQRLDVREQLNAWLAAGRFRTGPVMLGAADPVEAAISQAMRTLHMAMIDADMALLEEPFASDALPNLRLESGLRHPCAISITLRDGRMYAELRGAAEDASSAASGAR